MRMFWRIVRKVVMISSIGELNPLALAVTAIRADYAAGWLTRQLHSSERSRRHEFVHPLMLQPGFEPGVAATTTRCFQTGCTIAAVFFFAEFPKYFARSRA